MFCAYHRKRVEIISFLNALFLGEYVRITSLCIQHRQEDDWEKIVEGSLEKWRGISLSVVC